MILQRVEEFQLTVEARAQIADLLKDGFEVYPEGRSYYKQLPDFRILAWEEDLLLGHLAGEYRMINVGNVIFPVFGVSDLCVRPSRQQERIATQMLAKLEELAKNTAAAFILLTGSEPNIYERMGFVQLNRRCRWLMISDLHSLGVIRRSVDNLMIKPLGTQDWPDGEVDFLGHIF